MSLSWFNNVFSWTSAVEFNPIFAFYQELLTVFYIAAKKNKIFLLLSTQKLSDTENVTRVNTKNHKKSHKSITSWSVFSSHFLKLSSQEMTDDWTRSKSMQEPISTTTKRYNSVKVDLLTGFESVSFGHDRDRGPGRGLGLDHDLHLAFECIAEHNVQLCHIRNTFLMLLAFAIVHLELVLEPFLPELSLHIHIFRPFRGKRLRHRARPRTKRRQILVDFWPPRHRAKDQIVRIHVLALFGSHYCPDCPRKLSTFGPKIEVLYKAFKQTRKMLYRPRSKCEHVSNARINIVTRPNMADDSSLSL